MDMMDDLAALLAFITPGCGLYNTVYTVYMMGLIDDVSALLAFITPGCGLYEVKSSLIRNVQITEDGFTVQDKVFNNF